MTQNPNLPTPEKQPKSERDIDQQMTEIMGGNAVAKAMRDEIEKATNLDVPNPDEIKKSSKPTVAEHAVAGEISELNSLSDDELWNELLGHER